MSILLALTVTIGSLGHLVPNDPEVRTWTSRDEQHICQAELVSYHIYSRVLALRTPDKKFFKVYLVALSKKDKGYIESLVGEKILVDRLKTTSYGFPCGPFNKDAEDSAHSSSDSPFKGMIKGKEIDLGRKRVYYQQHSRVWSNGIVGKLIWHRGDTINVDGVIFKPSITDLEYLKLAQHLGGWSIDIN